jgi:AcrR family transcriptional regulator
MEEMPGKRGRPRNTETQMAILTASYELLVECGFDAVTVEKIADRAKVSKATIYKWWPNKAAVVMDGFLSAASARLPVPDSGSVFEDVRLHAASVSRFMTSKEGNIIKELIAHGQSDSGLADALRTRYIFPRRSEAGGLIERGIRRGELKESLDIDLCIDLIYGPIFYRLLVTGAVIDEAFVDKLISLVLKGIGD